jgi:Tfp pilus assembly protein PilF
MKLNTENRIARQKAPTIPSDAIKNNKTAWIVILAAILTAVTTYTFWPSLHAGFTNWDDPDYIHLNTPIHNLNSANIRYIFTEPLVSNYHPLTLISLGIDYSRATFNKQTGIPDAYPFHQTNIILHLFNVLLVFLLIYRLSKGKMAVAFFTAFLFGIHPMHVESVSWITERKDVLFGFFFLISLVLYLKYVDDKFFWGYWLSLVFFILSLLSKPAAAPFGLILLLIDYYRCRFSLSRFKINSVNQKLIGEKIPFILLGTFFILITYIIQSKSNAVAEFQIFSITQRIFISMYGFCTYLQKLLIPANLSTIYPYPISRLQSGIPAIFYFTFIFSLGIIGFTALSLKRTRIVLFGVLFYLFMLLPVLQFVSIGSSIMSERYTYIPYIGIFFMAGMGLDQLWNTRQQLLKPFRIPAVIVVLLYMGIMTAVARERTHVWENSETLWTNVIEQFPGLQSAYKNRGNYYANEANEFDKAMADYEKIVALGCTDASIYSMMGNIYSIRENHDKAIELYSKSISLDISNKMIPLESTYSFNNYQNRGFSYMKTKQYELAIPDFSILLQKYPGVLKFHFNRGLALANTGRYDQAKADFLDCLKLDSTGQDYGTTYYNLGFCYIKSGDLIMGLSSLNQAKSAGYPVDSALLKSIKNQLGKKNTL